MNVANIVRVPNQQYKEWNNAYFIHDLMAALDKKLELISLERKEIPPNY